MHCCVPTTLIALAAVFVLDALPMAHAGDQTDSDQRRQVLDREPQGSFLAHPRGNFVRSPALSLVLSVNSVGRPLMERQY